VCQKFDKICAKIAIFQIFPQNFQNLEFLQILQIFVNFFNKRKTVKNRGGPGGSPKVCFLKPKRQANPPPPPPGGGTPPLSTLQTSIFGQKDRLNWFFLDLPPILSKIDKN